MNPNYSRGSLFYILWILVVLEINFFVILGIAWIGFGIQGMKIALIGGSILLIILVTTLIVWGILFLGAKISIEAMRISASVFVEEINRIRQDSKQETSSSEIVTVLPPSDFSDLQLPEPRDRLIF